MTSVTERQDPYLASFDRLESQLAGGNQPWLVRLRQQAIERFAELGFPTTHDENWKYTSVAPIAKVPFQHAGTEPAEATPGDLASALFPGLESSRLVFVNGRYRDELSSPGRLPDGVKLASLAAALEGGDGSLEEHLGSYARFHHQAFVALNTAFFSDGAFVYVPKRTKVDKPIHLLFVSTAGGQACVSHPRNLVVAGCGAQATIIESYFGLGDGLCFTNGVTELVCGENSVIEHYKVQQESERSFHVATLQVYQERSSNFVSHSVSLGGALVRNDLNLALAAEGIDSTLNGLYVATRQQHVDNHTAVDHAMPHCSSHELYKGILDGRSTAVFNGKIFVRKDAQKTDARQTNKNLLLSEDAVINTKPQLEIYADDVKCTHGATVGQLDEEAVFYLRSRGIGWEASRALLTRAFAGDIFGRMKVGPVRTRLEEILSWRLSAAGRAKEAL